MTRAAGRRRADRPPAHAPLPHAHGAAGADADVAVPRLARLLLLVPLALAFVAALVGLLVLWPDAERVDAVDELAGSAAPGVTYPAAVVREVEPVCEDGPQGEDCGALLVRVAEGADEGAQVRVPVPPEVLVSGLRAEDGVQLVRTPAPEGGETGWGFFAVDRDAPLGWLTLLFVVVVLAVARLRGVMALVGLAFSGAVLWRFTLPALLVGGDGLAVALVTATLILVVVLYTTHGPSLRTSAALAGTLLGVAVTVALGLVWSAEARLTGVSDESGGLLSSYAGELDFRGLLTCALVIAGLGVLNDVTITQSSAVWELRAAAPSMSRRALLGAGMRIGRDHIASTIYTIVFAYGGTSLVLLMLLFLYDRPLLALVSSEQLAEEVVRTLTGAIGLVLAVPLTTAVAVAVVGAARTAGQPAGRSTQNTEPSPGTDSAPS